MKKAFPSPQPKGRGVNVKRTMCHIQTSGFFPAILAALSITSRPGLAGPGTRHRARFAGSLTAISAAGLGLSGPLRPRAGLCR